MKHTLRFIILTFAFVVAGTGHVWANITKDDIIINVLPNSSAGTVDKTTMEIVANSDGTTTVTFTASHTTGYSIDKDHIIAEKMVNAMTPRRTSGIASSLPISGNNPFTFTIPEGYTGAYVTVTFFKTTTNGITSLSQITDLNGTYVLTADINAAGYTSKGDFKGTLDGGFHKIYNLSEPLFTSTSENAVIRNITFEAVGISINGNVGAVTGSAAGNTRIYNCGILPSSVERDDAGNVSGFYGSSVGSKNGGDCGGIVGVLSDNARVINCYSYATITGGNNVGGIVGNNTGTSSQSGITTMVMNCMFYGDITSGSTVSPVYGGYNIDNTFVDTETPGGLATYNYYAYSQLKSKTIANENYHCTLGMEERFLVRDALYRQLLNSNKKLAAKYASTTSTTVNPTDMAKWVLETADRSIVNPYPYPVLKAQGRYPSIINIDIENAPDSSFVGRLNGGRLDKTLSVKIDGVGTNAPDGATLIDKDGNAVTSRTLKIARTDKDSTRYNFNYDKIQLPYYNDYGTKNYTQNKVVTGWIITDIDGGTPGTFTEADEWGGYNFADRRCTNKDLYDVSHRVFSQGAYYDVPYGVKGITIKPYWGKAAYVSDKYYDVVYKQVATKISDYAAYSSQEVTGLGTQYNFETGTSASIDIYGNEETQTVYSTIDAARSSMSIPTSGKTVYDYAVVLVGNVHQTTKLYSTGNKTTNDAPYTIMSIDLDKDNEPDYSFIFSHFNRQDVSSIRFDFLNVIGTAEAQKPNGAAQLMNVSIFNPKGWFEVTNTCTTHITQFEADNENKTASPVIFLGGIIDQYTSTKDKNISSDTYNHRTSYIHLGSNACFREFGNGTHSDGWYFTNHVPVSVTGGDFEGFYLSGVYRPDAQVKADDAEGYISGGRFKEMAGAAQQMIDGSVHWQIYDADITNFYGGGINADRPITGNVTTDIINSHVGTFCGGPKFGDMQEAETQLHIICSKNKAGTETVSYDKTIAEDGIVTTNATGCTFGTFFGAGYGGASSYKLKYYDNTDKDFTTATGFNGLISNFTNDRGKYYDGKTSTYKTTYGNKGPGVATEFDYEFFVWSSGAVGARFYVNYTTFSLAKTRNVNSTLTKCTVEKNFYGGGSLGVVDGTATSILDGCTVTGSVYGGGFSASIPTVPVRVINFKKTPIFNKQAGIFYMGEKNGTQDYKWTKGTLTVNQTALDGTNIKTDISLHGLGQVTTTKLTVQGNCKIDGSVYGGGEQSGVDGNTDVTVKGGTIGTIGEGGMEYGNVYGGGKGSIEDVRHGIVKGDTKVTIENTGTGENMIVPFIQHNVYGGGAYGSVGTYTYASDAANAAITGRTSGGKAEVVITGGTFGTTGSSNGMIFGSSRGDVGAPGAIHDKLAWVYNTEVKIGPEGSGSVFTTPQIKGSVYGGGENGHVFNDASVYIYSGTVGITSGETITDNNGTPDDTSDDVSYSGAAYPNRGNVYGAGCGTDKYYIGAIPEGHTATDGKGDTYNPLAGIVQGNTTVNISGGHVVHNVYGAGAMGSVGTTNVATSGKTTITVTGGRIGYDGTNNEGNIFGAARGDLTATGDLAQVRETEVNINYGTTPAGDNTNKTVQLIAGSVFGGGEAGIVKGSVALNMTGGLVLKDVYGGGALADTQTSNWDASANNGAGGWADADRKSTLYTTTVRLTGGTILGEAYGGALGEKTGVNGATSDIPAFVYGDVLLDLNGTTSSGETGAAINNTAKGCVVGQVFGCNNINGSPKGDVMVHVYATQNKDKGTIAQKYVLDNESLDKLSNTETDDAYVTRLKRILSDRITIAEALSISDLDDYKALISNNDATAAELKTAITNVTSGIDTKNTEADKRIINSVRYDVEAVYGGGNMAAYVPVTPNTADTSEPNTSPNGSRTQVIIEGCTLTSIETVYGGGNAAAVPETNVTIHSAYEIGSVFGGGNGKDKIIINNQLTDNPGADVGTLDQGESRFGTGNANSLLKGGHIHEAYGGSNTKGIVKGSLNQTTDPEGSTCTLILDKIVGAGKYADIDGDVNMNLSCQPSTKVPLLFAGADEANVNGNITLNITNGNFGKVFGGNNLGGAVKGKITVNVEETGCQPIKIDELYLGGNEAAYSVYGYYESDETHPVTGLKILKPRTAEMHAITDETAEGYKAPVTNPATDDTHTFPYAQPELNIISCTYIGKVFGGGLGAPAMMYANPTVNVNMVPGRYDDDIPTFMTSLGLDVTKTAPNPQNLGIIGDVFGGGNEADIVGNTTVNIAVEYVVKQVNVGASVTGYYTRSGAGTTADPFVYTAATGTAVEGKTYYEKKAAQGSAYIIGSVFGGGNAADVLGNTNVTMSDGYVFNGIFGGGYAGNVGTFTERSYTEKTDVGTVIEFDHSLSTHECIGKPTECKPGTGKCTVLVDGGQIGPISVAIQGEGMNRKTNGKYDPVPQGWVWGGGQGLIEDPAVEHDTHFKSYVGSTDVTIGGTAFVLESIIGGGEFGRVLGDTKVTITGNCQIGVGEGKVDTNYKPIRYTDAQFVNPLETTITSGTNGNALVECSHFPYGEDTNNDGIKDTFLPYDPYYDTFMDTDYIKTDHPDLSPASTEKPSDGKTWIGCVFAGGSGYMPYLKKDNNGNPVGYDWCSSAGLVERNTELIISGGHILTNVYGGNEVTNVKGKCKITMTGGTIGVPRTVDQIIAHPLSCYLFGAGKGDQRRHFNKETNVGEVEIEITGGIIYGSVFGGGEDGHVLKDVTMTIGNDDGTGPIIGTWGTSYVDGNVFGGGRGFGGDAYTAGNVAGCVDVKIKGGSMLGSVYGGGRLGSVGYGLYESTETETATGHKMYGEMQDDGYGDWYMKDNEYVRDADTGFKRGHVDITISGGIIGNEYEYKNDSYTFNIDISGKSIKQINDARDLALKNLLAENHIPYTEFEVDSVQNGTTRTYNYYRLKHTKGGNVFAGGMGRLYQLDGTTPISLVDWWKLGCVKSTKLTITGGTIKSNVYGGGEMGQVVGYRTTNAANESVNAGTEIIIQNVNNTTIGTEIKDGSNNKLYTFGSVFGGGYGSLQEGTINNQYPKLIAGLVKKDTKIDMQAGAVKASIYGGGEMASVGESTTSGETTTATGSTYVAVSGGTVGIAPIEVSGTKRYFGGPTMGNVYGGGSGHGNTVRSGKIFKNTNVTISGSNTRIYHNVYGGGAYGTVGDFDYDTDNDNKVSGVNSLKAGGVATVTITGGTVGYDGKDNGMVFGSSRGDINEPGKRDDYTAWVYDTHVTIGTSNSTTGPLVKGSVYGSGENGHVFHNTDVKIYSGTVGIDNDDITAEGYTVTSGGITYNGPEYSSRGNVYGGGCGTDTYTKNNKNYYNPTAGIVNGNTNVTMTGGHVVRAVYGGGSMGSVGTFTNDANDKPVSCVEAAAAVPATETTPAVPAVEGTGLCTVTISGGKIGPTTMAMPNYYGNVFGAGRGEMHDPADYPNLETTAYFNKTEVTINGTAFVKGSVYGGAESGHVLNDTHVVINGSCQIGCGYDGSTNGAGDLDRVYTPAEWAYDVTTDNSKFLYECNSWPYQAPYAPYDKFANANGEYSGGSSADNARPTGTDGHTFYGNVFGGGSGSIPYAAGKWLPTAGCVEGNTSVEINGGHILTSVYGGNEMSDVGAGGVKKMTDLENESADMFYDVSKTGGKCTVKMKGGTIGVPRTLAQIAAHPVTCNLFGAGKGDQRIFFNKTTNVKEVEVEVSGGKIYGSVFGGGEDGHVLRDVKVTIGKDDHTGPVIGTWGTSYMDGNVFGGGRGFSGEALTAGNVGGSVEIDIQGGSLLGSVYGGGRLGSVGYGLYLVDETVGTETPYGVMRPDNKDDRGNTVSGFKRGYITINISGGTIGNDIEYKANPSATDKLKMPTTTFDSQNHLLYTRGGNVFAGCMGRLYGLDNSLLTLWPKLGRCKQTELNITGGIIKSNVYGGAELGVVQQNTKVNITGGQVGTKIGTGSDAYYYGSVFGGGKGSTDNITYPSSTAEDDKVAISEAGSVEGNVTVELNKDVEVTAPGGKVRKIFGCNDMNGTPKGDVLVHIHATQNEGTADIKTKPTSGYDVDYVFGGGNNADYVPTVSGAKQRTEVIIEGCDLTSIEEVYGGGYGAATPGTKVEVRGTKIINNLFGGGYGAGQNNPGANVGKRTDGTAYGLNTGNEKYKTAVVQLMAGRVNNVYGGSNTKGDIRGGSSITNVPTEWQQGDGDYAACCENLKVGEIYGGGKSAPMEGGAEIVLGCMPDDWIGEIYAGAQEANVGNDVSLTITSGKFEKVFGGNNISGTIDGSIEVNIEECPTCNTPIIIGELYGGGNMASYTVPDSYTASNPEYQSPRVNVRSFTSIGAIYGGGYGSSATVNGNPMVNINVGMVKGGGIAYAGANKAGDLDITLYPHEKNKIGVIGNVFGGGNAAPVNGSTYVNIGTNEYEVLAGVVVGETDVSDYYTRSGDSPSYTYTKASVGAGTATEGNKAKAGVVYYIPVVGADIRGNVYGGGNNAEVTGNTNVNIGKEKVTIP